MEPLTYHLLQGGERLHEFRPSLTHLHERFNEPLHDISVKPSRDTTLTAQLYGYLPYNFCHSHERFRPSDQVPEVISRRGILPFLRHILPEIFLNNEGQ